MSETRKLAAILVADVVGYSRLAGADEERILARLRGLRSDLIDPTISVHHGRVVKRTGDGSIVEFRSVVDAVRCAIEVQSAMVERNAGVSPDKRIEFRVGIHLGDVVEESDGDLMGDGVNIAARLEGIAAPGAICLSEDAYRQVKGRLDLSVADLGPKELKNIAEPIRVYSLQVGVAAEAKPAPPLSSGEKPGPPRLSIVVLPFANIGGDASQDYFVDGVTESLTTDLSRIAGSFVIGRNTAFAYKGKSIDLKQIGRELNVRYVIEGSVQRSGERMRINVQLIEAEIGSHLWAERFDKPIADLFDMQDEIVARLANQLQAHLVAAEARRAERSPDPDVTDLCFQAKFRVNQGSTRENLDEALRLYERALALDPDHVEALVGSAHVEAHTVMALSVADRTERLSIAEMRLTRALSLAPDHVMAHFNLGCVYMYSMRPGRALAEFERALALDRNCAVAHGYIGAVKIFLGRAEETEAHVQEALRLSPRDPLAMHCLAWAGVAKLYLGCDEEAVERIQRALDANRNAPRLTFALAAALANLGRLEEARATVKAALALDPIFTIAYLHSYPFSDNPTYLAQREHMYDGMRKAGVPEGEAKSN